MQREDYWFESPQALGYFLAFLFQAVSCIQLLHYCENRFLYSMKIKNGLRVLKLCMCICLEARIHSQRHLNVCFLVFLCLQV